MRRTILLLAVLVLPLGATAPVSGTSGTVQLVKDIRQGPEGSSVTEVIAVDEALYFVADDGTHGLELWKSDGTESGTTLVKDIWPGEEGSAEIEWYWYSSSYGLTDAGGTLYFAAASPGPSPSPTPSSTASPVPTATPSPSPTPPPRTRPGLWRSDGTTEGTLMVKEIAPECLTAVGSNVYFVAWDDAHGEELWRSDGTTAGTVMMKDIVPGPDSSYPSCLTTLGDTLYFTADDGSHGRELWRSDGTEAGTVMVKDVNPRMHGWGPEDLTAVGGTLYFSAADGRHGRELWRSDGTWHGTAMVRDIDLGRDSSYPWYLIDVEGRLFFWADISKPRGDSIVWRSFLWKSDGTEAGTVKVSRVDVGPSDPDEYWYLPGTVAAVGDALFFAYDNWTNGLELWRSDGTRRGTAMVMDIAPGPNDSVPYWLTDVGGTLYFFAFAHGPSGRTQLWTSDGTPTGTVVVKDDFPAVDDEETPFPGWITELGGSIFLTAASPSTGYELWMLRPGEASSLARAWQPGDSATVSAIDAPRRPACTITGTNGDDVLHGTKGPDVICARDGNDDVYGRGGDDLIFLGRGRDTFDAGAGDDQVFAGAGDDPFGTGGRGDDRIFLQSGRDFAQDNAGADLLSGGPGSDYGLNAEDGRGNDRLIGGSGQDLYCADSGDVLRSVESMSCTGD